MISRFFIDRPVFATVVSIVITLCGLGSLYYLPVEQSPQITPPTVVVSAVYPGATAETVSQALAIPMEEQLSGIENLLYFQSQCSNDGSMSITLSFEVGTDLDIAAVEVQNRLKRAERSLPEEVIRQGISVNKRSSSILGIIALVSDNPKYDSLYLANYAKAFMVDRLKRVPGVGDSAVFGSKDYSMRIWLNPDKLAAKGMTFSDVTSAIREQNQLYAAGEIGGEPSKGRVDLTFPVTTRGRLESAAQFEDIVVRAEADGATVTIKDVGRAELGQASYSMTGRLNGRETAIMMVQQQPDANAMSAMNGVKAALEELQAGFPEGVKCQMAVDVTKFIRTSVREVIQTFAEALLLVLLVVFVFLGSWRATIIPLAAVPVAIVGTFTGMLLLGFSVNTLTLFGLVLAIGIVVDDAIVVVENVERIMHEERLPPREATIKAMDQVTGPIIAIVLVLSSVYLPVAFLGGSTGVMYRQFGVTIALSVAISGLVALTLSPALCRLILQPNHNKIFFFRWFDLLFGGLTRAYTRAARLAIRLAAVSILVFAALIWATYGLFQRVPSGFVPMEDRGVFMVAVALPQGASLQRTIEVTRQVEQFIMAQPEVDSVVCLDGQDMLSGGIAAPNGSTMFVSMKDWSERPGPEHSVDAVVGRVFGRFMGMKEATVLAFNLPPIMGMGLRAGFEMQLESRGGGGIQELAGVTDRFVGELNQDPMFSGVSGVLSVRKPQIFVDVDRSRAKAMGLSLSDIFDTLQACLGAQYVNDFTTLGRMFRVRLQADADFREHPDDIRKIHVRTKNGELVELSGVVNLRMQPGPNLVSRFNGFPSVQITGAPAAGYSTGQTIQRIREIAAEKLPIGYGIDWSGASYQEATAGNQSAYVILFGLVMVFLVLAAQYEKWSLPLAVLLAVPFGAFGAILAVHLRGLDRDIYFQIGLLTLIGLAAKNAILIVEFCSKQRALGQGIVEAAIEAARLRLRPIVMTSLAFILGVLPLVISEGAGAASRHSIGTGVMGGMLAATFLAIFFVPLFFAIIQWISERLRFRRREETPTAVENAP
ncbi:MAG TPA: multidrug efflux RND transporter permease subunit [Candidatus Hydrogenedentes bacterium]|nr:multidrug efflux RND transporter permease subunit [Candidatus Hydrogenedentota bacterium]HOS01896.1 multidrug efflux RND transporter permease subunit [Candidatus Hydrogenedentota bacterium]